MVGPPGASRQRGTASGSPRSRYYLVVLGCRLHNLHYCPCTPLLLSPPQEHGPMPLTGAAASRLEPTMPMLMSCPDWYNFRVCLILQKPTVRTACFEKTLPQHCKPISDTRSVELFYHRHRADIFRYLDALKCHSPSNFNKSLYSSLLFPAPPINDTTRHCAPHSSPFPLTTTLRHHAIRGAAYTSLQFALSDARIEVRLLA